MPNRVQVIAGTPPMVKRFGDIIQLAGRGTATGFGTIFFGFERDVVYGSEILGVPPHGDCELTGIAGNPVALHCVELHSDSAVGSRFVSISETVEPGFASNDPDDDIGIVNCLGHNYNLGLTANLFAEYTEAQADNTFTLSYYWVFNALGCCPTFTTPTVTHSGYPINSSQSWNDTFEQLCDPDVPGCRIYRYILRADLTTVAFFCDNLP